MDELSQAILLSLSEGFKSRQALSIELSSTIDRIGKRASKMASEGLIQRKGGVYALTPKGRELITKPEPSEANLAEILGTVFPDITPLEEQEASYSYARFIILLGFIGGILGYTAGRYL